MKIRYEGAPMGIYKIKAPPKIDMTFVDGICEVEEITGRRLLVNHPYFKQVTEPEVVIESKESTTPEIPKVKLGRPARKIEEVEAPDAIKDFIKQI
jgi:hypothetical protein